MSNWKLRPPDRFPKHFLSVVEAAYLNFLTFGGDESQEFELLRMPKQSQVAHQADRFHCFRWCLRQYPMHPLHKVETGLEIRLRTVPLSGEFALRLRVRRKREDSALLAALVG